MDALEQMGRTKVRFENMEPDRSDLHTRFKPCGTSRRSVCVLHLAFWVSV